MYIYSIHIYIGLTSSCYLTVYHLYRKWLRVLSDKVQRPIGRLKLLSFAHCLKSVFGGFLSVKHAFLHFNRLSFGRSLKATKIRKSQDSRVFTICLPNLAESLWLPCLKSNLVRNLRLVQLVHENPKGDPNIPGSSCILSICTEPDTASSGNSL